MVRILVVDDDSEILTLEKKILERDGYDVTTSDDGAAAIRLLAERDFDLLLLDVMMPGVDGYEVSRSLERRQGSPVPVVFVTAHDDPESMRKGFRSGGTVFLSKPFTANQLSRLVKSMLDRS